MTAKPLSRSMLPLHSRRADIVPMLLPLLKGPFTVEAYQRLGELGVIGKDERVELINGQIVEMSPIGDRHAHCVRRLLRLLSRRALDLAIVDAQNPVALGPRDAPQPDLAVLKPRADAYPHHPRPADILLLVEVADTTLAYDRDIKLPRYAAAGIPEVWVVDLAAQRLVSYREPAGDGYAEAHAFTLGDQLAPLGLPSVSLAIADILG